MYNQAKNVVFNVSEMEAKVRDATNDDPWGASSTLMQEIAQGTFNFQNFNEIMPAIYTRFMEKEAKQWRQIYKALQLLEYLVKNGSERVVDDARSHIATIKMLRNFYYIDDKGKDQGLNVRNRSKELVELLSDVEKIRVERRKAKVNKHKYIGTGNDAMSFSSGGSRYGGFGSDSLGYGGGSGSYGGDYSGRDYNDSYSASGSNNDGGFRDSTSRRFQEYDAGDDEIAPRRSSSISRASAATPPRRSSTAPTPAPAAPAKPAAPATQVDLLGMDDDVFGATVSSDVGTNKALPVVGGDDDDFADFQAAPLSPSANASTVNGLSFIASTAPTQPVQFAPPFTQSPVQQHAQRSSIGNAMASRAAMQPMNTVQPMGGMQRSSTAPMQPATMFGSGSGYTSPAATPSAARTSFMSPTAAPTQNSIFSSQPVMSPTSPTRAAATSPPIGGAPKPAANANFDDIWSMSLGGSVKPASKPQGGAGTSKSMKDLEKEKAQAGIWASGQARPPVGAGFGSFGGSTAGTPTTSAPPASSQGNGLDDLLF